MRERPVHNLARQRAMLPTVIGRCKIDGDPIRTGDDTVWLLDPMGLSHTECKDRADAAAAAAASGAVG